MLSVEEKSCQFNRKIKINFTGGELSSDSGHLIFKEFDEKLGFSKTLTHHLVLNDSRKSPDYSNEQLLRQKIYQLLAGYSEDDAADSLIHDPVFTQVVESPTLASQPTLSRFYDRFDPNALDQLGMANQKLLDKVHRYRKNPALILDLDSTHVDTYGKQESSDYNAHYGTIGFHPLVAFDGATGDFLKAKLRPGNRYTSHGVVDFVRPILEHYNEHFPETTPLVRADSGFATPDLYEACETESVYYVIRLKTNAVLQRLAEELHPNDSPTGKTQCYYEEFDYQAKSWGKPRRVAVQSIRPANELFFTHTFIVTNLVECFSPKQVFQTYQKRGTMENYIKEAKSGFSLDQLSSHKFEINEVRLMLSLLAYNLTNWMRTMAFPKRQKAMRIETIRTRIVKVASKLVRSGRSLYFKLSSSFVYQAFFWNVLNRIQQLHIE
ncbi:IS1380 family transposase [Sporolactobacillus terrae]|uniref:IS1380 family transposase n=1 Tax=Sporolactobacillus terrae TaxID=269673 RepID=UPI001CBA8AA1|nr:IS1380 family transposase [Sporolactobacillus terrae]UAK17201.1 IS1380 family transposase [Sporolactobacillus terrae]